MAEYIFRGNYIEVSYLPEQKLIRWFWWKSAETASESDIKEEMQTALTTIFSSDRQVELVLTDDRQRRFVYGLEFQKWMALTVSKTLAKKGIRRWAVVSSEDFIAQLSSEQTLAESEAMGLRNEYPIRYFDTEAVAMDWLLNI